MRRNKEVGVYCRVHDDWSAVVRYEARHFFLCMILETSVEKFPDLIKP